MSTLDVLVGGGLSLVGGVIAQSFGLLGGRAERKHARNEQARADLTALLVAAKRVHGMTFIGLMVDHDAQAERFDAARIEVLEIVLPASYRARTYAPSHELAKRIDTNVSGAVSYGRGLLLKVGDLVDMHTKHEAARAALDADLDELANIIRRLDRY